MNPTVEVGLIAAIPATLGWVSTMVFTIINRRKIQQIHVSLNGKMEEFMRVSVEAATARGHLAGVASEKAAMKADKT